MTSAGFEKKMLRVICVASLIMIAAGAIYYFFTGRSLEMITFAAGVAASSVLNALRLHMLRNAVETAVNMKDGQRAGYYIHGQHLLRLMMTGALLLGAVLIGNITGYMSVFWGAVAGIFTIQIAAHSMNFIYKEPPKS